VRGIDAKAGIGESGQRRGLDELALAQIAVYAADAHGDGLGQLRRREKRTSMHQRRNFQVYLYSLCAVQRRGAQHAGRILIP
jgi:hypothetical protein